MKTETPPRQFEKRRHGRLTSLRGYVQRAFLPLVSVTSDRTVRSRLIQIVSCLAVLAFGACKQSPPAEPPAVLLFNGDGTSRTGVRAIEAVLKDRQLGYTLADSA